EDKNGERRRCVVRVASTPSDPDFLDAFLMDARAASGFAHSNLAEAIDVGMLEGSCYVATELVRGVDLLTAFGEARRSGSPIPVDLCLWLAHEVCEALVYLHRGAGRAGAGPLVHRNVSLPNIMVDDEGVVRLMDYGVSGAESVRASSGSRGFTGRSDYASPEQLAGKQVSEGSDLFSLGVVMHEFFTGHRLFHKEGRRIDREGGLTVLEIDPPSSIRRELPPQVDSVVMRALEHDPRDRYSSAREMQLAIRGQLLGEPSEGREKLAAFVRQRFGSRLAELDEQVPVAATAPPPQPPREAQQPLPPEVSRGSTPAAGERMPEKASKTGVRAASWVMWLAGLSTLVLAALAGWVYLCDSTGRPLFSLPGIDWPSDEGGELQDPRSGFVRSDLPIAQKGKPPSDERYERSGDDPEKRVLEGAGRAERAGSARRRTRRTAASSTAPEEGYAAAAAEGLEGDLLVVCSSSCTIYVDGERKSRDGPGSPIRLKAGTRLLRVVDDATSEEEHREVLIAPGRVAVEEVRFSPSFRDRTGTEEW
ncbi:MAG: serine/threonine protein kinase, partial [Myxococcota bacterium]